MGCQLPRVFFITLNLVLWSGLQSISFLCVSSQWVVCDDSSSNLSKFMYFIMSCDREEFLIGIQSSISSTYSLPFFLPLAPRLSNFFFASAFQSKVFSSLSRSKATTLNIYFIEVNLNCVILCVEMEKDQKNLKSISFSQFISIKNIFREEK